MEKDKLKLPLLEKIIACDEAATLKRVEGMFSLSSEIKEEGEQYVTKADSVPAGHYEILEEEFKKYNGGEIKGISWEDFREEIKSKHGF